MKNTIGGIGGSGGTVGFTPYFREMYKFIPF
jgi:hypothetical protein